jgi:hypothetical protein
MAMEIALQERVPIEKKLADEARALKPAIILIQNKIEQQRTAVRAMRAKALSRLIKEGQTTGKRRRMERVEDDDGEPGDSEDLDETAFSDALMQEEEDE